MQFSSQSESMEHSAMDAGTPLKNGVSKKQGLALLGYGFAPGWSCCVTFFFRFAGMARNNLRCGPHSGHLDIKKGAASIGARPGGSYRSSSSSSQSRSQQRTCGATRPASACVCVCVCV